MSKELISIIIPCRNEEGFIYKVLENIRDQDYGAENLEVIISDGLSDDQTKAEVEKFQKSHSELKVQLIDNPHKTVPFALNEAIKMSSGEIIIRMDAHSIYPKNYVSVLENELNQRPDAWNVGGCWDTKPGADTTMAKAIVIATSHKVGIGNAEYRLESTETREVDTVPFGCFRKSVFEKIGDFDEDLTRNQDDEFNGRIIKNGGKIYLIPTLKIEYSARATFSKMAKMFYQYGYFKPLVNKKLKSAATARQFAPLVLVLAVLAGWIPTLFWWPWILIYAAGIVLYLTLLKIAAFQNFKSLGLSIHVYLAFIIIHFSYGWGYLKGIFAFLVFGKEKGNTKVDISR